jgi:hypothetical protein
MSVVQSILRPKCPIFVGTNDRAAWRERIDFNKGQRFPVTIEERINTLPRLTDHHPNLL